MKTQLINIMKTKIKLILSAVIILILTIWAFAIMPWTIDKLNKEIITSIAEQDRLTEANKSLRVKRDSLTIEIETNSNEWHKLEGKKDAINKIINLLEQEDLGK